jgi:hypothetical protein
VTLQVLTRNKKHTSNRISMASSHGKKSGSLPKMAIASRGSIVLHIGSVLAAGFCERISSCSNLVVTEGNYLLSQDLVDKIVVLHMNNEFIEFVRREYRRPQTPSP